MANTGDDTSYNRYAGQSVGRIEALSDGMFAVAMTLIVLEIHVPGHADIHTEWELWNAIVALSPRFLTYFMSFLTLGIFWVGQQSQLNCLARSDRDLTWIHFAFLALVATLPFSTSLLADYIEFRLALVFYWLNILGLGAVLFGSWSYSARHRLVRDDVPPALAGAICRRILIAQGLYLFGALLCVFSTYWSIAFIVLVQLNYAIAPRLPLLRRI